MNESPIAAGEKVRLGIFTYPKSNLAPVLKLIAETPLADHVAVSQETLGKEPQTACDIVMAILASPHTLVDFTEQMSSLKKTLPLSVIVAMIPKDQKAQVAGKVMELSTDEVLFYPLPAHEFSKAIMTHVASIRIHDESKKARSDLVKSQALLGQLLVENHIISSEQLDKALEYQKGAESRLGDLLVMFGFISEEQKVHFLASQLGVEVATPRQFSTADLSVVSIIPEHIAKRYNCLALEKQERQLIVAMDDVLNLQLLDILRDISDQIIKPVLATSEDIKTSIDRFYRDIASQKDASNLIADLDENVEYVQSSNEDVSVEEAAAAASSTLTSSEEA